MSKPRHDAPRRRGVFFLLTGILLMPFWVWSCAHRPAGLYLPDLDTVYPAGVIVSGLTGRPVTFDEMLQDLSRARIVYLGEVHTDAKHHAVQLQTLQALFQEAPDLRVGMEMFDHSYQEVLDRWSAGELDEKAFLEKTHWYANWRHDFSLYRDLLSFIRDNRIPLFGLNIPFHLPAKIAIGGLESLHPDEKRYLPRDIDLSNADHRAYVEAVFKRHHLPGRDRFETFYLAQVVWEEAMAEQAALHLNGHPMVVLVGNGHIVKKFGIPERAYRRTGLSFRTLYPVSASSSAERSFADYLWVTP